MPAKCLLPEACEKMPEYFSNNSYIWNRFVFVVNENSGNKHLHVLGKHIS